MKLTDEEKSFLEKRMKLLKWSPLFEITLAVVFVGFSVWMFFRYPSLANPLYVWSEIQNDAISVPDLSLSTALLPVVVLTCLVLVLVMIFFGSVAFRNEKKHITVIRRFLESAVSDETEAAATTIAKPQ